MTQSDPCCNEPEVANIQGNCDFDAVILVPQMQKVTAEIFGVSVKDVRGASRGVAPVALARQAAMYLCHVVFGLSHAQIGNAFNRDRSTATHACRVIEDRRDENAFDCVMSALEAIAGEWLRARRTRDSTHRPPKGHEIFRILPRD